MSDLRSAFRHLVKSPGFSAVAILTLAVALGVNSAMFSMVNGLVLKPTMPREPDRVVSVFSAKQSSDRDYREFSYQEFQTLREAKDPFTELTAVTFGLAGLGEAETIRSGLVFFVAENFLEFSGARPAAGRFFVPEEGKPNAEIPVVVSSYGLWQRGGLRPDFVGSTVRVNGRPHTVIGVAPKGFAGISMLFSPEVWLPLGMIGVTANPFSDSDGTRDLNQSTNYTLNLRARMPEGMSIESARALLPVLDARLNALLPPEGEPRALQITTPSRLSVSSGPSDDGPVATMGLLMCAMAGIVLLIACLNLANLLLARGSARAKEIAVRQAIGATRWQIVRQLSLEGLVLALAGGALGLLFTGWINAIVESSFATLLASVSFSLSADLQPDLRAIAVTFGFCLFATLVFSVGPAWRASRANLVHDLKSQGGDPVATGRFNRFFAGRHVLVMTQMALSLTLVFGSGLFLRAALRAGGMDLGFKPEGLAVAAIDYSLTNTPKADSLQRYLEAADRVRAMPGVKAAGFTSLLPYGNISQTARVMPAGAAVTRGPDDPAPGEFATYASISHGYFASLGVSILRGRDFTEAETRDEDSPRVAIIDEGLARRLFPDDDAIGRELTFTDDRAKVMTIVGIASRHRQDLQDETSANEHLYVPLGQNNRSSAFLCVRFANESPEALLAALPTLRQQLRGVDPQMPVLALVPFQDVIDRCIPLWVVRLAAVMFGAFGGIALLLATVGVYGVKAYTVERRTREIGIRMALGADRRSVCALILRQGALQTLVASVVGIVLALAVGQALASMLYDVSPTDPLSLFVATALLGLAAMIACWVPARRATKVNPNEALRTE